MKPGDTIRNGVKRENSNYSYDIILEEKYPTIKISLVYNGWSLKTIVIPKDTMIRALFAEPADAEKLANLFKGNTGNSGDLDESLEDLVNLAADCLEADVEQGFADRFIDDIKNRAKN